MLSPEDRRVEEAVRRVLADPLSWPKEMKEYIGRYLELDQPSFRLSQIHGWKAYVGNNTSAQCTNAVTLTSTPQTVTGCEVDVANPGLYQVTGLFEFEQGTGAAAIRAGWKFPTATAQTDNAGGGAWSDANNILANDGNNATVPTTVTGQSDFLYGGFFNFNVSPNATITGVDAFVEASETQGAGDGWTLNVSLHEGGVGDIGTPKTVSVPDGSSMTEYGFGDPDDLWGTTTELTPAFINDDTFTLAIWATAFNPATEDVAVDYVLVGVYGTGLWEKANGFLYVDEDPQEPVVQVQEAAMILGGRATASGIWIVETTAAATFTLRASTEYDGGLVEAETGTTLGVLRIN